MEHLEEKQGYKYTQSDDVDIKERVIAIQVYTPDGQSERWRLITDEEAEQYTALQEAAFKEEQELMTADIDSTTTEDNTVEIDCPSCGRKIYYTPPTDEASTEEAIMVDDEL